tara:strand:+ start:2419 stop:2940 length:522 start_codon:yes stop_codon:yes gene_type:complete
MKYLKILIFSIILINFYNSSNASEVYFVDIKKILNTSKAGKQAQDYLKKRFENENKKFEKEGVALKKEETDLIAKKKLVSKDEYKKNLTSLRNKSINFQKKKRQSSNEWIKKKNEARSKLISSLRPILQKYMADNKIEMIVDKKYVLLANSNFDLTEKILKILDKEVKSINLN